MQRLQAEQLEGREVMSVTLAGGVLNIVAADGGGMVMVSETSDGGVEVNDNGTVSRYNAGEVSQISFTGGAGDDVFLNYSSISDAVDGGAGADFLFGGYGESSVVRGGDGNDFIIARAQTNTVSADGGSDFVLILGGTGNFVEAGTSDIVFGLGDGDTKVLQAD